MVQRLGCARWRAPVKRTGSSTTNYNIPPGRVPLNATPSNRLFHAKFAVLSSRYSMDRRQCLAAYMQLEAAAQSIRAAQALSLFAISSFNARNSISPTTSLPRPLPLFSSHPYQLQSPQLMLSLALYSPSHINLTASQHHHRLTLPQRLAHRLPASCSLFKPVLIRPATKFCPVILRSTAVSCLACQTSAITSVTCPSHPPPR
jgi:hypothetical protein